MVENHCGEFNMIHIRVAIPKLSKLIETSRTWREGKPGRLNEAHWAPLFDRASVLADFWSSVDVARLTYAVSAIEGAAAAHFMEQLQTRAFHLMPEMQLRELARLLHGLAHSDWVSHRLLEATVWRAENLLLENAGKKTLHWGLQVRPHFKFLRLFRLPP